MNQNVMSRLPAAPASDPSAIEESAYAKVFRRVVPFIMICYVVAYLDRINVGFAKLQMEIDLGFSQTVYGLGAGPVLHRLFLLRGA
jgi:sugar phosphate permease